MSTYPNKESPVGTHGFLVPSLAEDQNPAFVVSKSDNWNIQRYVTLVQMINLSPSGSSKFADISQFYEEYKAHVGKWEVITKHLVDQGSVISQLTINATDYLNIIQKYISHDEVAAHISDIAGMIGDLHSIALQGQTGAATVVNEVEAFEKIIQEDIKTDTKLKTKYEAELQRDTDLSAELHSQLAHLQSDIVYQNSEYDKDVAVAASTPAYSWNLIGFVIAIGIAASYGKRATDALKALDNDRKKIAELQTKLTDVDQDIFYIQQNSNTLTAIGAALPPFMAVVQKVKGIWESLADDLKNIDETNITMDLLKSFKVIACIDSWKDLKVAVDSFRNSLEITVQQ